MRNRNRNILQQKAMLDSVRTQLAEVRDTGCKDLARALAKLSPGGMSEFVQSVPVNVAGFLMRSAAQSAPLRLWPTEYDKDDVGPAAIEACG